MGARMMVATTVAITTALHAQAAPTEASVIAGFHAEIEAMMAAETDPDEAHHMVVGGTTMYLSMGPDPFRVFNPESNH
jgi:hypothetical protein